MTGLHENLDRDEEPLGSSDKNFGLWFAAITGVIAMVKIWRERPHWEIWAAIALILLIISFVRPSVLSRFNRIWTRFGLLLFHVVNPVVMFILYVATIVPIGLIFRLQRKDLLRLNTDPDAETYWIDRSPAGPSRDSMPLQF